LLPYEFEVVAGAVHEYTLRSYFSTVRRLHGQAQFACRRTRRCRVDEHWSRQARTVPGRYWALVGSQVDAWRSGLERAHAMPWLSEAVDDGHAWVVARPGRGIVDKKRS
jgi:hypothetical protein